MGNAANVQKDESTGLDAIATLLKLFQGTKSTISGGGFSETSQTNIEPGVLQALLKQGLESNQGLAAVTQGQKAAGLYNSSTNKLLANDLLARLTANAAAAGASKTTTRTAAPQVTQAGGSSSALNKAMLGLTAAQKLGLIGKNKGPLSGVGAAGADILSEAAGLASNAMSNSSVSTGDLFAANRTDDPIGALITSQGWSEVASSPAMSRQADTSGADTSTPSFDFSVFATDQSGGQSYAPDSAMSNLLGSSADAPQSTPIDWNNVPATESVEDTTNFSSASSTGSSSVPAGGASSSEVLANSTAANTTLSLSQLASGAGASAMGLYSGISALSDGNSENDVIGAASAASGAYGAYNTYQAYQAAQAAEAARAAAAAAQAASAASSAGSGAAAASTAADASTASTASSSGGSILGYIGPVLSALSAPDNPKGEQEKDYRHAVGSAVLNYFGFGWAAPIVHEVAQPALNASMEAGTESLGTFGAVMADPVGAPLSGQYDVKDLVVSTLDPGNIFGGNEGGSSAALVAATLDPVGAALGDTGANQFFRDTMENNPVADAIGKVICTEMAMQDKLPLELYQVAISPKYIMRGRILDGYHVWGVSFVKALRKSPKLSSFLAPYVSAYIEHKSGIRPNWAGFWIKNIMHPVCWLLSFFSRDKKSYLSLYRRERKV